MEANVISGVADVAHPATAELRLGDCLPVCHPTATVYLDESGVVNTGRFFGIGCLKVVDDWRLTKELHRLRQVHEFQGELHWSKFGKATTRGGAAFGLAAAAIDLFFECAGASFCCRVADRQKGDLTGKFGDSWSAYEALSVQVLDSAIERLEVVSVVADHTDTPSRVCFEDSVRCGLNEARGHLTAIAVNRAHSHAVDGLQVADLLLGAVMFDFRRGASGSSTSSESQKAQLSDYLLERCGVPSFRPRGKRIEGKLTVEMSEPKATRRARRGGDRTSKR